MEDEYKKSLFVSIVGDPNVGKSSLLNMILGEKISIVSPKPQTTRNKIIGIFTKDNVQIVFTDTPGILKPKTRLGNCMLDEINNSFSGAEAIIQVVEVDQKPLRADSKLLEKFRSIGAPVILAINKIDLLKSKSFLMKKIQNYSKIYNYKTIIPVSAIRADGRQNLIDELEKMAKFSVFFYDEDDITDQSMRQIASEIIREKMLYLLDKELPHGSAVFIEKFHKRENKLDIIDINALIQCDRENHKAIIIGRSGNMIKRIGTMAREELEQMMKCKINLKLWVKVKENWRNSDAILRNMGYILENK